MRDDHAREQLNLNALLFTCKLLLCEGYYLYQQD